jgi:hypothetical protein
MKLQLNKNLVRVIILDISGIYSNIYNEGYFDISDINKIKEQYSNQELWRVLVLD